MSQRPSVRKIALAGYKKVDEFLEKFLYRGKRPRTYEFLLEKLKENPELFLGLYLDDELIGVVQGFPRDDYLLMSEIAVDIRFRKRGFASQLVKAFEEKAKSLGYKKIKLGAQDEAIELYTKNKYLPSLFIQVHDKDADEVLKNMLDEVILGKTNVNGMTGIEIKVDKIDMTQLEGFKKRFNPVSAQFLFTKAL